jgi:hypothetical protein
MVELKIREAREDLADGIHGAREEMKIPQGGFTMASTLPNHMSSVVNISPSGEQSVCLTVPVGCNPAVFLEEQILDYVDKIVDQNMTSFMAATTPAQKGYFQGRHELASDLFTDLRSRLIAYSNPGRSQMILNCALTFSDHSKCEFE